MSIILISPYGSNDLLIRFTHLAIRQFKDNFLFGLEERHVAGNPNKIDWGEEARGEEDTRHVCRGWDGKERLEYIRGKGRKESS